MNRKRLCDDPTCTVADKLVEENADLRERLQAAGAAALLAEE